MKTTPEGLQSPGSAREYRYERKFFVDQIHARQAISLIKRHPGLFSEIYPERYINNIYYDSPLMDNYMDNVDGAPKRIKARVRWYHDLFGPVEDPVLEFKIKTGLMGTKIQYPFPEFRLDKEFNQRELDKIVSEADLPLDIKDYLKSHRPVLINRYLRWYFATPDLKFRITVDTELTFYHLNKYSNQFLHHQRDPNTVVIELKYNQESDPDADRITSGFPFRMTRNSKYVQGIDRVYF